MESSLTVPMERHQPISFIMPKRNGDYGNGSHPAKRMKSRNDITDMEGLRPNKKVAFVTLIYGNLPFFVEAMVLAKSLERLRDRADIILMLGDGVSIEVKDTLKTSNLFTHIIQLPELEVHDTHIGSKNRWNKSVFKKIFAWRLTQYNKVMFVDADVMVKKHDEFFDLFRQFEDTELPGACLMGQPMLTHHQRVTITQDSPRDSKVVAGLLLLSPSSSTFRRMVDVLIRPSIHAGKYFTNHEEVFLGTFFQEWMTIHIKYQYIPFALFCHDVKQYFLRVSPDEIKAFHFSGYKPHAYLMNPSFMENDKKTYKNLASDALYPSIKKAFKKWYKTVTRLNKRTQKRLGKYLTELGDWQTQINYRNEHQNTC